MTVLQVRHLRGCALKTIPEGGEGVAQRWWDDDGLHKYLCFCVGLWTFRPSIGLADWVAMVTLNPMASPGRMEEEF